MNRSKAFGSFAHVSALPSSQELWEVQEIIYIASLHVISPAILSCRIVLPYSSSSPLGKPCLCSWTSDWAARWPWINLIASDRDLHSSPCPGVTYWSSPLFFCHCSVLLITCIQKSWKWLNVSKNKLWKPAAFFPLFWLSELIRSLRVSFLKLFSEG